MIDVDKPAICILNWYWLLCVISGLWISIWIFCGINESYFSNPVLSTIYTAYTSIPNKLVITYSSSPVDPGFVCALHMISELMSCQNIRDFVVI